MSRRQRQVELTQCEPIWNTLDSVVESKMLMEYDTRRQDDNLGYLRTQKYLCLMKLDSFDVGRKSIVGRISCIGFQLVDKNSQAESAESLCHTQKPKANYQTLLSAASNGLLPDNQDGCRAELLHGRNQLRGIAIAANMPAITIGRISFIDVQQVFLDAASNGLHLTKLWCPADSKSTDLLMTEISQAAI